MSRIPIPRSQSGAFHSPATTDSHHHHGSPLRQEVMSAVSSSLPETRKKQSKRDEVSTAHLSMSYTSPPPERVPVDIARDPTTSSLFYTLSLSLFPPEACGHPLMPSFPYRPFARKSSPNWPANAQSLQPVYPLVRSVQLKRLPRKELLPHSVHLPPSLFRRTLPSPKQASYVPLNERTAFWSLMMRKA